jgi:protein-S-isoprenylcysteine O-methyltransferase Ste14
MNETYTKPKILPPVWLLTGGLTEFALDRWLPLAQWLEAPWTWLGGIPLLAGLGAILWAAGAFNKAETGIVPFSATTALVTHGLYRVTRNPMYLGMALILTGLAVIFGSVSALLPVIAFVWIIDRSYICNEEIFLRQHHGQTFDQYRSKVRRWV